MPPVKVGERFDDPWLRAVISAPSAQSFMTTSTLGEPDYRTLRPLLRAAPTFLSCRSRFFCKLGCSVVKSF